MISDALSISIYSDEFMAMKAEALLLVCIYGKLILPCAHHYLHRSSGIFWPNCWFCWTLTVAAI